jgi:hypothetical protein
VSLRYSFAVPVMEEDLTMLYCSRSFLRLYRSDDVTEICLDRAATQLGEYFLQHTCIEWARNSPVLCLS